MRNRVTKARLWNISLNLDFLDGAHFIIILQQMPLLRISLLISL